MRFRHSLVILALALAGCSNTTHYISNGDVPIAVITGPGGAVATSTIEVDGSKSYDPQSVDGKGILTWEWTLVGAPAGSTATISASQNDQAKAELASDKPGDYQVQLRVRAIKDFAWSIPTVYELHLFPVTGIALMMHWQTANDMDVHLVNDTMNGAFFMAPGDCFFQNLIPVWTPGGEPALHQDVFNGTEDPEILELPVPSDGTTYHAYIHFFSDYDLGPSDVSLDFYVNGALSQTLTHSQLAAEQVWDVATITWSTAAVNATITPVDSISSYIPE